MKQEMSVFKQCVKDGNLSPQLDNIEFNDETIIIYKDGNLIVTPNKTSIRGYINSKTLVKTIESFESPQLVDTEKSLIVKEGKRKVQISKYLLSGGESHFEIPKPDAGQYGLVITEKLKDVIELCAYSAKNSNINTSGDGIIIDFTGKFKKIYSSNGTVMTVANVFSKDTVKAFIPLFIVENIIKYYTEGSTLFVNSDHVIFENENYRFISLYTPSEEIVDINKIVSRFKSLNSNLSLTDDLEKALETTISLTDKYLTLQFKKNLVNIYGYSNKAIIEDSVIITNEIDSVNVEMKLNKDFVKYAIKNFNSYDICQNKENDIYFIKFKKGKISFYISPVAEIGGES